MHLSCNSRFCKRVGEHKEKIIFQAWGKLWTRVFLMIANNKFIILWCLSRKRFQNKQLCRVNGNNLVNKEVCQQLNNHFSLDSFRKRITTNSRWTPTKEVIVTIPRAFLFIINSTLSFIFFLSYNKYSFALL